MPQIWQLLDRDAAAGAGAARDFVGAQARSPVSSTPIRPFGARSAFCQYQSSVGLQAFAQRHARLIAELRPVSKCRGSGAAVPPGCELARRRTSMSRPACAAIRRATSAIDSSSVVPT